MYNNHSQRRSSRPQQRNGFSPRGRNSNSTARNFESNGPANFRVRGKPIQIHDKYVQLARDAAANGDKILTEDLLQHAEHYLRLHSNNGERSSERTGERSSEKNAPRQQPGEAERSERAQAANQSDASYRSYAPRANSRRRWAVAPEGSASEQASEQSVSGEDTQPQAEVERRSSMPVGGGSHSAIVEQDNANASASASVERDEERDYAENTSYE